MRKSFNNNITARSQTQHNFRGSQTDRNALSKSQGEMGTKFQKDLKVDLKDVQNEIRTIKSIFSNIKQTYHNTLEQNLSQGEFSRILREFSIVYPKDKLFKILNYLSINPYSFSLKELSEKMDECKIVFNEITSEDITSSLNTIKDIIFSLKSKEEIFKGKNNITKEDFTKLIATTGTNLQEVFIHSVYNYITKTDRPMTKEEFTEHFM